VSGRDRDSTAVVALAGGVGAARFLRGLVRRVAPADVTVIVNTGDDRTFYGVHVSPDLDIVTYTLAGRVDREKGYGLEGDSFAVVEGLAALGHETWFRLGDRDLANCLHRTLRLREIPVQPTWSSPEVGASTSRSISPGTAPRTR
jgi:LPPG:FO 2-phospho-L-lactate transferase